MRDLIKVIKEDLYFYGGKSFWKTIATFFFKNSFLLMMNYRLGHYFINKKSVFSSLLLIILKHRQIKYRNCQFSYESSIGRRLNLPHPVGIVIGAGVKIGDDVTIYQNVTIGQKNENQYPTVENGAIIFPTAIVVGEVIVGEGSKVGAISYLDKSVPKNSIFIKK